MPPPCAQLPLAGRRAGCLVAEMSACVYAMKPRTLLPVCSLGRPEAADQFGAAGPFVGIDQFGDRRGGGSSDYPSMVSGGKNAIRMLSGFGASPDPRIASQVRRGARYEGAGQFGADGFFSTLGSAAGGLIDRIF